MIFVALDSFSKDARLASSLILFCINAYFWNRNIIIYLYLYLPNLVILILKQFNHKFDETIR